MIGVWVGVFGGADERDADAVAVAFLPAGCAELCVGEEGHATVLLGKIEPTLDGELKACPFVGGVAVGWAGDVAKVCAVGAEACGA